MSSSRRLGGRTQITQAIQRTTVEGDHHVGRLGELRRVGQQLEPGEVAVVRRGHERLRERGDAGPTRRRRARDAARASSRARRRRESRGTRAQRRRRRRSPWPRGSASSRRSRPPGSRLLTLVEAADDLFDAQALHDTVILPESQLGQIAAASPADQEPARKRGAADSARRRCRSAAPGRPDHRVEDVRDPQIGGDLDAGERHEAEARIGESLELVGEDVSRTTSFTRATRGYWRGCCGRRVTSPTRAMPSRCPGARRRVRRRRIARRNPAPRARCGRSRRHHRDADRRSLPLVLMVDLGHRHLEAVPQAVQDRPDRRPLGFQRPALGHVEIKAECGRMHPAIFAPVRRFGRSRALRRSR